MCKSQFWDSVNSMVICTHGKCTVKKNTRHFLGFMRHVWGIL